MKERQQEIDKVLRDGFERDKMHQKDLKEREAEWELKLAKEAAKTAEVQRDMAEIKKSADVLFEEKFKFESILTGKDMRIRHLDLELLRATEEIACRKIAIDHMSENLLAHEKECSELAGKLSMMKQQIIENETGFGMEKKYGCVKINKLKNEVCTVSRLV